jgi:STE24 endopeptidase
MNIYGVVILATILIDFLLSKISDYLNLKNMSDTIPDEFKDTFDKEKYVKSQLYTQTRTKYGFIIEMFDLSLLLIFWFSGGFNYLDHFVRSFQLSPIWSGVLFIFILMAAKSIISLPFDIYSTFVIEERFGFNKTTPGTFILDRLKALGLGVLLGIPLLAIVLGIFQYLGSSAWLYGWGVTTLISLLISYIAPRWILPLFNKFEPLEDGELKESIMIYAQSVDYSLAGIYKIDGSKRSTKSNAFFTGFGKNKRIALYDTLIGQISVKEMTAVLAHEIGHYKKKHIISGLITGILQTGVMFYLLSIFLTHRGLFDTFFMQDMSIYAGLLFFGMLYSPIELLLSIGMNIMSRRNEFQADRFACDTTHEPESMINALKQLTVNNLMNLTPHPFYVFLNYSHPPVLDRIKAMRKIAI